MSKKQRMQHIRQAELRKLLKLKLEGAYSMDNWKQKNPSCFDILHGYTVQIDVIMKYIFLVYNGYTSFKCKLFGDSTKVFKNVIIVY